MVAGAGRAFSAGFDLDMETGGEGRPDPLAVRRALENDFRIIMRFWDSPEADHRRRARLLPRQRDGARARLRPHDRGRGLPSSARPEVKFGSGIVAMLLPWLAGPEAREVPPARPARTGVTARRGMQMGLVNQVVPADRLMDEAFALGRRIAANDRLAVRSPSRRSTAAWTSAGMRQALLQALELDVDHRDHGDRRITRIQRDPEARRRQGRDRLAERERQNGHEKNDMNKPGPVLRKSCAQFLERYPATQLLELLQPDMLGILRGKRVVRDEFAKPFKDGVNFCGATVLLDARARPSSASTTAAATATPMSSRRPCPVRWRRCPGRRCRPPRCCSR